MNGNGKNQWQCQKSMAMAISMAISIRIIMRMVADFTDSLLRRREFERIFLGLFEMIPKKRFFFL